MNFQTAKEYRFTDFARVENGIVTYPGVLSGR